LTGNERKNIFAAIEHGLLRADYRLNGLEFGMRATGAPDSQRPIVSQAKECGDFSICVE
jgi:hypothetical protein